MVKIVFLFTLFLSLIYASKINIAVAANVSYAIPKLVEAFNQQYPEIEVGVTLGSSGKLTAQIKHGAPYDIFMSANMAYPQSLYDENIAITKPHLYAQGAIALLSKKHPLTDANLTQLSAEKFRRIVIANPKTAPYGKASLQAIENSNIIDGVRKKLIYAESISQVVMYTIKAADIGFVAKSSLYSPTMAHFKEYRHWVSIDTDLYTPIQQGIVLLQSGAQNEDATKFYHFILSLEARNIFASFGYIVQ